MRIQHVLGIAFFVLGCAKSPTSKPTQWSPVDSGAADLAGKLSNVHDLSVVPTDDLSSPIECVAVCNTDDDCANSCPPVIGGVSCCDTGTNTCYTSQDANCPAPPDEGDMSTMGPY